MFDLVVDDQGNMINCGKAKGFMLDTSLSTSSAFVGTWDQRGVSKWANYYYSVNSDGTINASHCKKVNPEPVAAGSFVWSIMYQYTSYFNTNESLLIMKLKASTG